MAGTSSIINAVTNLSQINEEASYEIIDQSQAKIQEMEQLYPGGRKHILKDEKAQLISKQLEVVKKEKERLEKVKDQKNEVSRAIIEREFREEERIREIIQENNMLEVLMDKMAIKIQACARGFMARKLYNIMQEEEQVRQKAKLA